LGASKKSKWNAFDEKFIHDISCNNRQADGGIPSRINTEKMAATAEMGLLVLNMGEKQTDKVPRGGGRVPVKDWFWRVKTTTVANQGEWRWNGVGGTRVI